MLLTGRLQMKRIVLTLAGLVVLLFLAVPVFAFWLGRPAVIEKQILNSFEWGQVRSTGSMVALSRNDEAFNFFDIGDFAPSSQPLVQDVLNKLSNASGVKMERAPAKSASIVIFHDTNVFTRLKRFHSPEER
jgi:hypothetical protein